MPHPILSPPGWKANHLSHDHAGSMRVTLGCAPVDARLGGGLAHGALHELFAAGDGDASAVAGFAVLLCLRGCLADKPILWVREDRGERSSGRLYALGLADLGADPDNFYVVHAPDILSVLRAGADIARCGAVGAVVIEPWGKAPLLDLTASRRLSLAAARSGVMALVLRSGVDPHPSAAQTRWRIGSAATIATPGDMLADALGAPAFDIELIRHRGGLPGFTARLEWDRDRHVFREAPLSGGVSALPSIRTDQAVTARAA